MSSRAWDLKPGEPAVFRRTRLAFDRVLASGDNAFRMKNITAARVRAFRRKIWDYDRSNRRVMPWRGEADPYRVLVSEIMLQQTRVDRVLVK